MTTIPETVETMVAARRTVGQAVAAVMAELPSIGKDDRSPEGYSYRGIEAVTKQVQPLFAKHGVVIVPRATITDVRPSPAMKDGWTDVYMQVEWTIAGPDGSTLLAQTTGIGRDRADKGANKAQTQAFKYLLLHLLCIADGKDDSDGQTYEHDQTEQADQAPCPSCHEVIPGARTDKEPMRRHMVDAHEWVRNEDGTVAKPKGSEATALTGPEPEGGEAKAHPAVDPPASSSLSDDATPEPDPFEDRTIRADPEKVDRLVARVEALPAELAADCMARLTESGIDLDDLGAWEFAEAASHIAGFQEQVPKDLSAKALALAAKARAVS